MLLGILPAVVERDFSAFGAALHELQLNVGAAFAPVQGGIYSSPRSEAIIAELGRSGTGGRRTDLMGPDALRVRGSVRVRASLGDQPAHDRCGLDPSTVTWTRAANHGALLERVDALERGLIRGARCKEYLPTLSRGPFRFIMR